MLAAVVTGRGALAMTDDLPEPEPGVGEVLVELEALGVCGSDVAVARGEVVPPRFPWVIGHEAVGVVVGVGEGVSRARVGERVVVEPNYPCGSCVPCRSGVTAVCERRVIAGRTVPGFACERFAVPDRFAWTVGPQLAPEELVCVEPVAVALHAASAAGADLAERCLVVGAGSQGLLLCQVLMARGAAVDVVEPVEERCRLAEELGAHPVRQESASSWKVVFETSGTANGLATAVRATAAMGRIVLVGIPHGEPPVPVELLVRRQLTVVGSIIYDHPGGFEEAIELVSSGKIGVQAVVRHRFALCRAPDALRAAPLLAGKSWIANLRSGSSTAPSGVAGEEP